MICLMTCLLQSCGGWTSYGAYFATNPALQWRLPLGIQILSPLLLVCGSHWLPESPRWLIRHGKESQGMTVLENLHRTAADPDATGAHAEFQQIRAQIELESEQDLGSLFKCLREPRIRKRMMYGFLLQWLLQSTGVLVVFNYQVGKMNIHRVQKITEQLHPSRPSYTPTLA